MTRERRASWAEAPAFRITWASPRLIPKAADGSMRASMQVTVVDCVSNLFGVWRDVLLRMDSWGVCSVIDVEARRKPEGKGNRRMCYQRRIPLMEAERGDPG